MAPVDPFGHAVVVRPATPADHPAVAALTVTAYATVEGVDTSGWAELADAAGRAVDADLLVAVDGDGEVVGTVTYVPDATSPWAEFPDDDAAGMRLLAVAPSARGRGVARALVAACLERARAAGRARIVLHTMREMPAAQRLYQRAGFRRAPARDWEPEPGLVLLGFERTVEEVT